MKSFHYYLNSRGFPLTKFFTNNTKLKSILPEEDLAPIEILNFETGKIMQNILGMVWNAFMDCFKFVCGFSEEKAEKLTRRVILSMYSRIFDPLGLIQPFILSPKLLIQSLSCLKLGWDDSMSEDNEVVWKKWFGCVKKLAEYEFDCFIIPRSGYKLIELHVLQDASSEPYAVVCFCRLVYEDEILEKFLFGKKQSMSCQ